MMSPSGTTVRLRGSHDSIRDTKGPLTRVECMYLSNTTFFDGRGLYSIYYIRHTYMFRRLTMVIFRLYMKYLVSSYTRLLWAVYRGEVAGEGGGRDLVVFGGWEVWAHGGTLLLCYV